MKVLLIEDDLIQAEQIIEVFEAEFKEVKIRHVRTESQFRAEISEIEAFAPDVIILDIMLRWADASADFLSMPEDVREAGHYRAGFRCLEMISNSKELYNTPVILHSVLLITDFKVELNNLPKHVFISRKDESMNSLLRFVRSVVKELPEDNLKRKSVLSNLVDATELKPGWLGLSIDLKSIFGGKKMS